MLNAGALGVFLLRRRVQRLLAATQTLSLLDPLTGLYNRRHLVAQAPRLWRQARRDGTRVAAMVLDLDHFKRLNDAHGHAAGDAVLRAVAASLTASVRPTDVLARTGGEELVVLGLVGDPDEAARLAERLRTAVANTRTADGHAVTASIGVALTRPVDAEDATDELWRLVDRADAAMYEAKQQGRDRVASMWVPRARAPLRGRERRHRPRRRGLPAGVACTSLRVDGGQAGRILLRWCHDAGRARPDPCRSAVRCASRPPSATGGSPSACSTSCPAYGPRRHRPLAGRRPRVQRGPGHGHPAAGDLAVGPAAHHPGPAPQ